MGRFSAPDDAQVGGAGGAAEAEPMDWTLISDDEHEHNNNNIMTNSDDDVMMLARMQLNDNSPADENAGCVAGEDSTSTSRGAMIAYNNTASLPASEMMENNNDDDDDRRSPLHNNAMTDNNSNGNNNNAALLQMTQQCLQQLQLSNDYNHLHQMQIEENYEQQRRRRKRNKTIILSIITIASIVTFVLKLHAPPPPPLVKQNSILALLEKKNYFMQEGDASLSSLVKESSSSSSGSNTNVNDITITHHETWGEYTSHIAQMTSTAIVYVASVFWYVVSNSFKYAALDLRDSIVAVMDDFRHFLSSSTIVATSDDGDESNGNVIQVNRERVACPIRIQAARNRHALLPRGVANHNTINNNNDDDATIMEGLSTEESLRQQLTSLPSQDIALQQIAQGIDSWGESMLEDTTFTVDVLHRMARFMTRMGNGVQPIADSASSDSDSASSSSVHIAAQHEHDTTDRSDTSDKENITLEWILPPAKGFLFVGPAGVGKLHVAQLLANWFFSHCNGSSSSSESSDHSCTSSYDDADNKEIMREPVLEIVAAGENAQGGDEVSIRRSIVEHIQQRKGLGSVVIIHHIEHLGDDGLLSDIVKVLNGHTNTISYSHDDTEKVASCEGTVFLLTTEQWGTKRLFQMIQQNDGLENLPREGLISAIRWEVDSHLQYWQRLNSHTTIVPFLPFQQDDLLLVLQSWFRELSEKYQGTLWARLDVSTSAIEYIVGADQVNYLDLYNGGHLQPTKMREGDESQQSSSKPLFTFSANGAHALYENSIYTALKSKLKNSTRRRPYNAAFLGVDQDTPDYILSWCDPVYTDSNECEIHWRLPVTFS